MREEFYAIIKLVSGEEILSLVVVDEHDDESVLLLQDPVVMSMNNHQNMSYVQVKPWLELTDESVFLLTLDKIITMTECKDKKLIEIYKNFNSNNVTLPILISKLNLSFLFPFFHEFIQLIFPIFINYLVNTIFCLQNKQLHDFLILKYHLNIF